ncbi:MAG: T9SS type A sorting domain-containing protein [Lentimicrobiaceae bacterium]|nr:T9SS type A sorting domain-containing protein [Lentimicrobiaceae bacterium]
MKKVFFVFNFLLIGIFCFSQATNTDYYQQKKEENAFKEISSRLPVLKLPSGYNAKSMPSYVDNSKFAFFHEIISQGDFPSCQQVSAICYDFTYEIDRSRNLPADIPSNEYPAHYTWNYLNYEGWNGSSFFFSFDVINKQGTPDIAHYGYDSVVGDMLWMNGYENYYNSMQNRIAKVNRIPLNTEDGIQTAKAFLYDRLDGSPTGGVFTFSASSPWNYENIPQGTPEAGKFIMIKWLSPATHGMTIVGYNDSIRYDLNNDGIYSNQLDNNNDGVIDVKDWEIGAFIFANSYGKDWANLGFCYVLYSAMALNYGEGGVSEQSGYSIDVKANYQPLLTMKVKLTHTSRGKICIKAGVSSDISANEPQHLIDFPIYNFQGGNHYLQGIDTANFYKTIEAGFDITPLLSYVNPGQQAKFFLVVNENDAQNSSPGSIQNFSVISYSEGEQEFLSQMHDINIANNSTTLLSVVSAINFDKIQISNDYIPAFTPAQPYSVQLQAEGGTTPYQWNIFKNYTVLHENTAMPSTSQNSLQTPNPYSPSEGIALPFQFPFYGKKYDSVYINRFGFVAFRQNTYPYPYCKDEVLMMKSLGSICGVIAERIVNETTPECWYEISAEKVDIRWQITDSGSGLPVVLNFCIRLFPSGEFEIIYGEISNANLYPLALGVSEGNELNFQLEYERNMNQKAFSSYHYVPVALPEGIELNQDGVLTFENFSASDIFRITIRANDANGIYSQKTFTASNGLDISVSYVAGNDDKISLNENALVQLTVKNTGDAVLNNINLQLSNYEGVFQLTDSTETISVLNPGDSITLPQAFGFKLNKLLSDGSVFTLSVLAQEGEHEWIKYLTITVASPSVEIEEPYIFDGSNSLLDPGETAELIVPVINKGSLFSENNAITLSVNDPYVSVLSSVNASIDTLYPSVYSNQRFLLSALRETPLEYYANVSVRFTNNLGTDTLYQFALQIGTPSVVIISLNSNTATADSLKNLLDTLQVSYKVIDSIPAVLGKASCVFLLLPFIGSGHALTPFEGEYLSNYLTQGGNLYMEGYKTWYYDDQVSINELLHYYGSSCSRYYFDTITGQNNTIAHDQNFSYSGVPNYAIYQLVPGEGSFSLFNNVAQSPQCVQFARVDSNFKAIGSMVSFASLKNLNDSQAKMKLLKSYLDFFNVNITNLHPLFHTDSTSVCQDESINFSDDSYNNIVSWQWTFEGGNPATSDEKQPVVSYPEHGVYDVSLSISDGTQELSIVKKDYITVNDCTHIPDSGVQNDFCVYPNPAEDFIYFKTFNNVNPFSRVELFDLQGRTLLSEKLPNGLAIFYLDIRKIRSGLYLLRLSGNSVSQVKKLEIK